MGIIDHLPTKHLAAIFDKIIVHPDTDCWEWIGCRVNRGLTPQMRIGGRAAVVSRVLYSYIVGGVDIYDRTILLARTCKTKSCCNPSHLMPMSAHDFGVKNMTRRASMEVCKRGHKFPPHMPTPRYCPICKRLCNTEKSIKAGRKLHAANALFYAMATAKGIGEMVVEISQATLERTKTESEVG